MEERLGGDEAWWGRRWREKTSNVQTEKLCRTLFVPAVTVTNAHSGSLAGWPGPGHDLRVSLSLSPSSVFDTMRLGFACVFVSSIQRTLVVSLQGSSVLDATTCSSFPGLIFIIWYWYDESVITFRVHSCGLSVFDTMCLLPLDCAFPRVLQSLICIWYDEIYLCFRRFYLTDACLSYPPRIFEFLVQVAGIPSYRYRNVEE
jgi:hypothetical protein